MADVDLTRKVCTPCRGGIPPLAPGAVRDYLERTPGWTANEDATQIGRRYAFRDFREALDFATRIGELAESEFHHPLFVNFGWGFCEVQLQTKKIKGLHENDFIIAAKMNAVADDLARDDG